MQSPIFGPFYSSRSTNLADQQCINLYPELVETKTGKQPGALYGTPGLTLFQTFGAGPIRGFHRTGSLLYVVSGQTAWSVDTHGNMRSYGTIPGGGICSIIDDGQQTAIFAGNQAFLIDKTSKFSAIALPFTATGDIIASYQDGFGVITQPGSDLWFQSDLLDLSKWEALNFASASANADNLISIAQLHREIYLIKEDHTEVWINAGTSGFVFQRLEGVYLHRGCIAPHSPAIVGEDLMWLSRNEQGEAEVVLVQSYTPRRISTHAIEREFQSYATISDAIGFSYQQEGHVFYVLNFPSGNATWVYDASVSVLAQAPMWHRRAAFDPETGFNRHYGQVGVFFNGMNLVGDYRNGNVYILDFNALTDNGDQRKWLRSWRALPQPSENPVRFSELRVDMQTGIGVPDGTAPQAVLRWSDDGGHLWSNERIVAVGPPGMTAQRVQFKRLGSTRRNSGLDRIFELSSTDQFPVALIGAEVG